MAESSTSSSSRPRPGANTSLNDQLDGESVGGGTSTRSPIRNRNKNNDLDSMSSRRDSSGKSIPAWKLREQMKQSDTRQTSTHNTRSIKPVSRTPGSLGANRTFAVNRSSGHGGLGATQHGGGGGGHIDPSLPPAFRAAFKRQQQRKREINNDDFMSLDSVHSGKSGSYVTGTPTTARNDDDESSSLGSESLDGHDSFASLGEDSDDDEAYRESKNMLARQEIEQQRKASSGKSGGTSRIKRAAKGVHGTPLDFIAE
jgi:hypothetical protein